MFLYYALIFLALWLGSTAWKRLYGAMKMGRTASGRLPRRGTLTHLVNFTLGFCSVILGDLWLAPEGVTPDSILNGVALGFVAFVLCALAERIRALEVHKRR